MITYKDKTYDPPPGTARWWLGCGPGCEEESRQATVDLVEYVVTERLFDVLLLRRKYLKKRQQLKALGASQTELDGFCYVLEDDYRKRYADKLLKSLREGRFAWLGPEYRPRAKE